MIATIGAGVAADPAGNANAASTSADNTVTWDNVPPTVVISLQAASDTGISNADNITNAASPVFDLTFSETVVGLLANDLVERRDGHDVRLRRSGRVRRRVRS